MSRFNFNATMARLGLVDIVAHSMAKAAVGLIKGQTPEMILQVALMEISEYGFSSELLDTIREEVKSRYVDDLPAMELLKERMKSPGKGCMVRTSTHGASEISIEISIQGACMKMQDAYGMEIGKISMRDHSGESGMLEIHPEF